MKKHLTATIYLLGSIGQLTQQANVTINPLINSLGWRFMKEGFLIYHLPEQILNAQWHIMWEQEIFFHIVVLFET